jgi:hypothetical protein
MNSTVTQTGSLQIDKSIVFKDINAKADRFIAKSLLIYFAFGIAISFVYGTWTVGLGASS